MAASLISSLSSHSSVPHEKVKKKIDDRDTQKKGLPPSPPKLPIIGLVV